MKLYFATQPLAQAKADALHTWMQANDAGYASSVQAGQTLRWTIPAQDLNAQGQPVDTRWFVTVLDRCIAQLTAAEVAALVAS